MVKKCTRYDDWHTSTCQMWRWCPCLPGWKGDTPTYTTHLYPCPWYWCPGKTPERAAPTTSTTSPLTLATLLLLTLSPGALSPSLLGKY